MSRSPDFEDLVGQEVGGTERERLLRTHELLLEAGPPPELPPHLASGPTVAMTLARRPRQRRQRFALLAAAVVAGALVFLGGYATGNGRHTIIGTITPVRTLAMRGTTAAPAAEASLELLPLQDGNWPMSLRVTGLPTLPKGSYYEVFLVHGKQPWESCGSFVVRGAKANAATTVTLNAPYRLHPGDSWVVTRQSGNMTSPGRPVLEPIT
jgi:hypothetical protein